MSYIQFESYQDKEKAREDLRKAREEMLNEAKKRAEQKAERETKRLLRGETNWMLPSVKKKLMEKAKQHKKQKKKKDKKHSKKSKKMSHKTRSYSTSEDESESDDSTDTYSTSSDSSHKKRKKSAKAKKKHKKKSSKLESSTSSDTASHEANPDKHNLMNVKISKEPVQRDSWMTGTLMLKTSSRERVNKKQNEKQQIDTYDPAKSTRELNPYWKTTGTGLPGFQKPNDDFQSINSEKIVFSNSLLGSKNWKKQSDKTISKGGLLPHRSKVCSHNDDESGFSDKECEKNYRSESSAAEFLTDEQMNALGAKIFKAEIIGNMSLADELRGRLEKARTQRNIFKDLKKSTFSESKQQKSYKSYNDKSDTNKEEHILLIHTDQSGNTRPLPPSTISDPNDVYCGQLKLKQKPVNCHDDSGKRVRYFADDDRYDIKQMFEREKYTSTSDANLQFANIAGKHQNPNDDFEDIFTEKICHDDSAHLYNKDRNRAIREHKKMETTLDNCDKCFDSTKMQKELLVCVGDNVYLSLPWYKGLQPDHCMIIPNQHASCCTQIDENTWTEINDFRKALTRMFASQHKDVIFFEIANKLHKRSHLVIHCIPIRSSDGEMAPFYFKKAIEESEHEWCINKQLVSLGTKSLRNSIPKGLPYFWVNFGIETGFAHVIEDEERFPANFAQEIIGGMLNLDPNKWRRMQKEHNIITKVKTFADRWKIYDCTK